VPILYEKSGAEGTYRRFKFEIAKIVRENPLPGFFLTIENGEVDEPVLRMTRRDMVDAEQPIPLRFQKPAPSRSKRKKEHPIFPQLSLLPSDLPDSMLAKIRKDFAGWDVYALKAQFDAWISEQPGRQPDNYASAFYGFVKRHHAKIKPA